MGIVVGMRINLFRRLLAAVFALGAVMGATPALAGSAPATSKAVIVTPLSFLRVQDLDFGSLIAGGTAGTAVIAPGGTRTVSGGVIAAASTFQPARFAGDGAPGQTVLISMSANSYTLTRSGGTQTMTIDTFVIGSSPITTITTTPLSFTIASATGIFNFPLGATLRVGANQTPGVYTGTFTVILNYQ
jgi:Domain of unknown function (DUF4402)